MANINMSPAGELEKKVEAGLFGVIKNNLKQYGMIIALVTIVILFQVLTEGILLRPLNITNIILQNSYILILAIGMLMIIVSGNIDLSIGSIAAFVGAVSAVLMVNYKIHFIIAIAAALAIGGLAGAWQGYWIAKVKIPAFIVTLGGQLIFRGLTMWLLQGKSIAPFPKTFQIMSSGFIPDVFGVKGMHVTTLIIGGALALGYSYLEIKNRREEEKYGFESGPFWMLAAKMIAMIAFIGGFTYSLSQYKGLPNVLILLAFLVGIYNFVMKRSVVGRRIYALGGNEKAAKLSGIKTDKAVFWLYVNMGVLAALSGLVFAARLNAATPKAGVGFELDAIAACYIGGASASGGIGTVIGTIVGALVMGVMNNGMSIMGVGIDWQQAIKGLVLIVAVAFDLMNKSKE